MRLLQYDKYKSNPLQLCIELPEDSELCWKIEYLSKKNERLYTFYYKQLYFGPAEPQIFEDIS